MPLDAPLVRYDSISINGKEIAMGSTTCRASYNSPYNKINVTLTPTNCSLSYYEVRVTRADEPYDIQTGEIPVFNIQTGALAYWNTSLELNKPHSFSINITPDIFRLATGESSATFRISFYAKSSIDGSWDVSYLLFTVDGAQLVLEGGEALCVLTTRDAPSNN